jgi:hypothetical protein
MMTLLEEASLEILLLFLPNFVGVQDLERVLISTMRPQSTDENAPSVVALILVKVARNWDVWCFRGLPSLTQRGEGGDWDGFWFVANH